MARGPTRQTVVMQPASRPARPRPTRNVVAGVAMFLALAAGACSSGSGTTATGNDPAPAPTTATPGTGSTVGSGPAGTDAPAGNRAVVHAAEDIPARFKGYSSPMYSRPESWMCKPGIATNHCLNQDLDSVVVKADGSVQPADHVAVQSAPVDCFYVYPTVNLQPGGGNKEDLSEIGIEVAVLRTQGARFTETCNVYAPLYHQMNLSAYSSPEPERKKAEDVAYADVLAAFKHYLANDNQGRPFVLIGHSQGSGHLARLMSEEFDADPDMQSRLVSALLIGGFVQVPEGKDVGGTFKNIPLCRSTEQNRCVVAYNSFGTSSAPSGEGFGRSRDGLTGACVNPAAPAGGKATLEPFVPDHSKVGGLPAVAAPFAQLPDSMTAECIADGSRTYLAISAVKAPGDARDVTAVVANQPGWGLHITEFNLTMGNLLDLVRSQTAGLAR